MKTVHGSIQVNSRGPQIQGVSGNSGTPLF